jgi:hypothetical protein
VRGYKLDNSEGVFRGQPLSSVNKAVLQAVAPTADRDHPGPRDTRHPIGGRVRLAFKFALNRGVESIAQGGIKPQRPHGVIAARAEHLIVVALASRRQVGVSGRAFTNENI